MIKIQGKEQIEQQIYFEYDNESTPLGKGGMGTVYLGRCVSEVNGAYTPVAIVAIANNSEYLLRRALREASVQIAHNNLIRIWSLVSNMEWDPYTQTQITRYYVVMEYLEGVNLESVLEGTITTKTGDIIPLAQGFLSKYKTDRIGATIDIMQDILIGVAELHANEYVHRGIDPSNAMLTTMGTVKVIDFGISKCMKEGADDLMHKLTPYGTVMGKMDYAAPEVIKGYTDLHNYSTDVYSLGIMLYQLAMGELPFVGDMDSVRYAQVNTPVPASNIPHWGLSELVRKATEKKQADRYQNAQEMLHAFLHLIHVSDIPAACSSTPRRSLERRKFTKRSFKAYAFPHSQKAARINSSADIYPSKDWYHFFSQTNITSKQSFWNKIFAKKYSTIFSSIFAPSEVKRKSHLQVQVYLHLYEEAELVKSLATESDKNAERRDYIPLSLKLKKGDRVDVEFNVYGETKLMSERKSLIWQGSFTKCPFDYLVPEDIDVDELSCQANLFVNGALIGEMRFLTQIVDAPRNLNPEIFSHCYKKIFISYAHKDFSKVKFMAQAYKAQGVDYFLDRDYLKAGDIYPKKIQDYINSADLFVLCWSKNAAESDYVAKEKAQALSIAKNTNQRDGTLTIHPISIVPRAELPDDMKDNYNFDTI